MTTNILALPLLSFPIIVSTNEDWVDSWAYVDANNNPISLSGLVLNFIVKASPTSVSPSVLASSGPTNAGLAINGAIIVGGTGGNVVALQIPRSVMLLITPGPYLFELQAQGDGETRTIASGQVTVNKGLNP